MARRSVKSNTPQQAAGYLTLAAVAKVKLA